MSVSQMIDVAFWEGVRAGASVVLVLVAVCILAFAIKTLKP